MWNQNVSEKADAMNAKSGHRVGRARVFCGLTFENSTLPVALDELEDSSVVGAKMDIEGR